MKFVIYNPDEKLFWSNAIGWSGLACLGSDDRFTVHEIAGFNLPIGGFWVQSELAERLPEAEDYTMRRIVPGSVIEDKTGLFLVTFLSEGRRFNAFLNSDELRQQVLKEEIITLVGEVLWDTHLKEKVEELEDLARTSGQQSMLPD